MNNHWYLGNPGLNLFGCPTAYLKLKMAFRSKIVEAHEDQSQVNRDIMSKIYFRNKIERSLFDLLDMCDTLTLDAFLQKNKMAEIGGEIEKEMDKFYNGLIHMNSDLTVDEREFIDVQIRKLDEVVKKRGETHISYLNNPPKFNFLRSEGGNGYTETPAKQLG